MANREVGDDEGNHGYKDGGWRIGDAQANWGWKDEQQGERLPAVGRCCYGLVCWQAFSQTSRIGA